MHNNLRTGCTRTLGDRNNRKCQPKKVFPAKIKICSVQPWKYSPQNFLLAKISFLKVAFFSFYGFLLLFLLFFSWRQYLDIDQHCIVFFVDCATPHLIQIVARLFERDEMESRKIVISNVRCRIDIKCWNGVGF